MAIARITGPGLAAIGISVAVLWGCLINQRAMAQKALVERAQVLREIQIQRLQHHRLEPVSLPSPRAHHRIRVTAG